MAISMSVSTISISRLSNSSRLSLSISRPLAVMVAIHSLYDHNHRIHGRILRIHIQAQLQHQQTSCRIHGNHGRVQGHIRD